MIAGTRIGASASSLNAAISMLRRGSQGHDALELFEVIAGTRIGVSVAVNAFSEGDFKPMLHWSFSQ